MILCLFRDILMVRTPSSKVNNWKTEITGMLNVKFEDINGTANILANDISRLMSVGLYDMDVWMLHATY